MSSFHVHPDVVADLSLVRAESREAAAEIAVTLEALAQDEDLRDRLTQHGFGAYGSADFDVQKWLAQYNTGRDLWRFKIWDLEEQGLRYRIVYAFIPRKQAYHILGVVSRDFNYDANHPISQRIINAYEDLVS